MDIRTLIRDMMANGDLAFIANNVRAQFGTRTRRYLGATLLPERRQTKNEYRESMIRYRTIIANDGTRYSPVQYKGGALTGTMLVELAESDIGSTLTAHDLDTLIELLNRRMTIQGAAQLTNFVNTTVLQALIDVNEKHRWEAIVNAQVNLRGDNEYAEDVPYSNPANHRVNAADQWSDPTKDPFEDIYERAQILVDKGYEPGRIIMPTQVVNIMAANPKVAARARSFVTLSTGGQLGSATGRVQLADINAALAADGLPAIERYDLQYRTQTGSVRFLPQGTMVMTAKSGQDETLDFGDETQQEILPDTLGYTGIGRAAGQSAPGRVIRAEYHENKPPRAEFEGWQTSLPVITQPEAVVVLKNIS